MSKFECKIKTSIPSLTEVIKYETTDKIRQKIMEQTRNWIKENPELHARTDNKFILAFLRGCKFNFEKTKKKIASYQVLRRDAPEWFKNRDPCLPEIEELLKLGVFVPLRCLNSENQLVIILRMAAHNPKIHKQNDIIKLGMMILEIATMEIEEAQINGVTVIFDLRGFSVKHLTQLTPTIVKNCISAWQNYHCRPKRFDIIYAPTYVNVILNVFKRFMPEKMKKRIYVHSSLGDLYEFVGEDILPEIFGGDGEVFEETVEYWEQKMKSFSSWFQDDEKYVAE